MVAGGIVVSQRRLRFHVVSMGTAGSSGVVSVSLRGGDEQARQCLLSLCFQHGVVCDGQVLWIHGGSDSDSGGGSNSFFSFVLLLFCF